MRRVLFIILCLLPIHALAGSDGIVKDVVERHILPGFADLKQETTALRDAAEVDCSPDAAGLLTSYHLAFDAWVRVSHLRFGPTEVNNRAFALAFWPDPRAKTRKALRRLVETQDDVIHDDASFQTVSIAARGFYALERLLFDPSFAGDDAPYVCALIRAVAEDIALTAGALEEDWTQRYADLMVHRGRTGTPYASPQDALRELYKTLGTGLQFAAEVRLARPLGTVAKPRPKRAEARLSKRSLRHITLSLEAMASMAILLSQDHEEIQTHLTAAFSRAAQAADRIDDPAFSRVDKPQNRLRVEALQQRIDTIRDIVRQELGPALGVSQGFNALDGD